MLSGLTVMFHSAGYTALVFGLVQVLMAVISMSASLSHRVLPAAST